MIKDINIFGGQAIVALTCLFTFGMQPVQAQTEIDAVLAVVNGGVITNTEFETRLFQTLSEMRLRQTAPKVDDLFKRGLLERMVTERIQLQAADRLKIRATDAMTDTAVSRIAAQNNMSLVKFKQMLLSSGITYGRFRNGIRDQLTIRQLVESQVTSRIVITDAEVENHLATEGYIAGGELQEFNLSHILIRLAAGATPEVIAKAETRLSAVSQKIASGALTFASASKQHSQSQDAEKGGLLGWRKLKQLPVVFTNAIKHLQVGQVSEVIRSPNGFHLLKLNQIRGQKTGKITETRVRHLLIKTGPFLSNAEARARAQQIQSRLVSGDDFTVLARASSDDALSSSKGGDLGWVTPGELVKVFENAMNKLKPNQISEVVTTPFGHHIIQVLERRQRSAGDQQARVTAKARLRNTKSEQAFEGWIRRLRDNSYIEFRTG